MVTEWPNMKTRLPNAFPVCEAYNLQIPLSSEQSLSVLTGLQNGRRFTIGKMLPAAHISVPGNGRFAEHGLSTDLHCLAHMVGKLA
ncbi:hypothetical protein CEXT_133611 [Caerostris extrusa]|uniref:Uncharacterized protein n=1 Tax=Caerostris extrusa TaxID=172846 RepID=A0AAV4NAY6_CAEEX|nr:hypothetical protein CEXT_133611 [Caerostris extrusa]